MKQFKVLPQIQFAVVYFFKFIICSNISGSYSAVALS